MRKINDENEILALRKIKLENLICKKNGILNKWIDVFR